MNLFKYTKHPYKPQDVNRLHDEQLTTGQKIADAVAATMGSWPFVIIQSIILALWIVLNCIAFINHWDPYPFILLNLALSFQAAYTGPFVLISQNRQAAKDRLTAEEDYNVNRKGEYEIEQMVLHLGKQDEELVRQTSMLLELLQKITDKK